MKWEETHGTWLGIIRNDQHILWGPKRGQWCNPREDEVEVSEWDLALGTNHDTHIHSLSMTDLLAQVLHLSGLTLIKSNLPKKSPKPSKSKPLGHPLPHLGLPFDVLAAARYKKATNCGHPVWTTLPNEH